MAEDRDRISIITMAGNEVTKIRECLESVTWADEVVYIDDYSTDGSLDIAREFPNVVIYQRKFDKGPNQYNFGIGKSSHPWVFTVDADERVSPRLRDEVLATLRERCTGIGLECRRLNYIGDQLCRWGFFKDDYQRRVWRKADGVFHGREVHEIPIIPGKWIRTDAPLIHKGYRDLSEYARKSNRWSDYEAHEYLKSGGYPNPIEPDDSTLTRVKKWLWKQMPGKPWVKFLHEYIIRQGFRDRNYGFALALLSANYVSLTIAKARELQRLGIEPGGEYYVGGHWQ
jgi:glycosyltransferase involved in cell wall biosynthesis